MITNVRIIKENSVYRVQRQFKWLWITWWSYVEAWVKNSLYELGGFYGPQDFKTKEEAEDYVKHHYEVVLIKEYNISNLKDKHHPPEQINKQGV